MRGLACLLMFQTHCYDSWLRPDQRDTPFFRLSQLGGTLPAPLFIFLAGISVALVTGRLRERESPATPLPARPSSAAPKSSATASSSASRNLSSPVGRPLGPISCALMCSTSSASP